MQRKSDGASSAQRCVTTVIFAISMQLNKSFAAAVKEGTPPRKKQDFKPTPPKLQQNSSSQASSDEDFEELDSGQVASQAQLLQTVDHDKILELNRNLLSQERKENEEMTIAEYMENVRLMYNIDFSFTRDFVSLVNRNDFCIDADLLKQYGILSNMSSSSHTLKLLVRANAIKGRDYITHEENIDKVRKVKYFLTPTFFKKLLIRTVSTDQYADYYLLLEKSVYFYQIYQLERKVQSTERLLSCLRLKEEEEEEMMKADFSIGQHAYHLNQDAGWAEEISGIIGLCVVDGIGGYMAKGYDSGIMARRFTAFVKESFTTLSLNEKEFALGISAERLLMDAWKSVRAEKIGGGITLVVGFVDFKRSILRLCQVGDCVAVVIRLKKEEKTYEIFFQTPEHQIDFNVPRMLSHDCSIVENALSHTVVLNKGDIIFVSSDGFVDNFDVNEFSADRFSGFLMTSSAYEIQKKFLEIAWSNSISDKETPFSKKAISHGLAFKKGGKRDDITLLVLKI